MAGEFSDPVEAVKRALDWAARDRGVQWTPEDLRLVLPMMRGARMRKINRTTWILEFPAMILPDYSAWTLPWGALEYEAVIGKFPVMISVSSQSWVANGMPHLYQTEPGQESLFDQYTPVIASLAFSIGTAGAGAQIGASVMGAELAASYPALASIVGNAALQTVINGGDVGRAVQGAVIAGFGSGAGGIVTAATDSATIGAAAGAAAQAAVTGGDISSAVASSLALSGAKAMDYAYGGDITPGFSSPLSDVSLFPPDVLESAVAPAQPLDYAYGGDITAGFGAPASDVAIPGANPAGDAASQYLYGGTTDYGFTGGPAQPSDLDTLGVGLPTSIADSGFTLPQQSVPAANTGGVIQDITQLALAVVKVNEAFQRSKQPPIIRYSAQSQTRINPDGTVTTLTNGRLVTAKSPVGQPYVGADGRTVINNGDGSYTTIDTNGASTTSRYSGAAAAAGGGGALLLLGIGALLLLRR